MPLSLAGPWISTHTHLDSGSTKS